MRRTLSSLVLLTSIVSVPALAADMGVPRDWPYQQAAPANNWTGFYAGIHGGYQVGSVENSSFQPTDYHRPRGANFGAQVGANWQIGDFVVGLETSGRYSWAKSTRRYSDEWFSYSQTMQTPWQWEAIVRAGYLVTDSTLVYAGAGGAVAQFTMSESLNIDWFNYKSQSKTTMWAGGYTLQAGVEQRFGGNWSVDLRYVYTDLNLSKSQFTCNYCDGTNRNAEDLRSHGVRLGLNYRF